MDKISFQSRIKFVDNPTFNQKISSYGKKNYVGLPWTVRESVLSDKVYTTGVSVCSCCVITDGIKALMLHLCPKIDNIKKFSEVESFIKESFGNRLDNLKAFLVGAMDFCMSLDLNNKFRNFLTENKVPFSCLAIGKGLGNDVAYSVKDDELLISSILIDNENSVKINGSEGLINSFFRECKINTLDEIV